MNSKRTNRLVAILNIVAIVLSYLFYNSLDNFSIALGEIHSPVYTATIKSIMNFNMESEIQKYILTAFLLLVTGVLNFICAFQNKQNKNLTFWEILTGVIEIFIYLYFNFIFEKYVYCFAVFLFIIGIIAIIFSKKYIIEMHKITRIKRIEPILSKVVLILGIISVIISIILGIISNSTGRLSDSDTITVVVAFILIGIWLIISIIAQFIFIHKQEDIEESQKRKKANIIVYYILETTMVVVIAILLCSIKIIIININSQYNILISNIVSLQEYENMNIIEENGKYGFVNGKGKKKIPCEYDNVTLFLDNWMYNKYKNTLETFYFAIGEKDGRYFIISKDNDTIDITNYKYIYKSIEVLGIKNDSNR